MREFFAMDGYAVFVWSSVAVFVLVIIGNWWAALRARRTLIRQLKAHNRRKESAAS